MTAMKVLHISNALDGGGAENVFASSLELLRETATECTHLSAYCKFLNKATTMEPDLALKSWEQANLTKPLQYFYNLNNYTLLRGFLLQHQPDVVHLHGFLAHLSTSVVHAIQSCRAEFAFSVVQTMHSHEMICANASAFDWHRNTTCTDCMGASFKGKIFYRNCDRRGLIHSWSKGIRNAIDRNLLNHAGLVDHLIAPSDFVRQTLIKEGFPEQKVSLVHNPVAIQTDFPCLNKSDEIVYFGRFAPEKNIPLLIGAFSNLLKDEAYAQTKLKLVGEGESSDQILSAIQAQDLTSKISVYPYQARDALYELIQSAKVMVLPSNCLETFSLVIPEAISLRMLPVVSNLGAMQEMVRQLQCGYCFENENMDSLTDTMKEAIRQYPDSAQALEKAIQQIRQELGGTSYTGQLESLYASLVNDRQ
jgi:glycosyltransferase involved in cell wall biosynthesis